MVGLSGSVVWNAPQSTEKRNTTLIPPLSSIPNRPAV